MGLFFGRNVWFSACSVLIVAIGVPFVGGCGGGQETVKTVPVSGVVTLDGTPQEGVVVQFIGPKHTGTGRTNAQGRFVLENGAQPGPNKVVFTKIVESAAGVDDTAMAAGVMPQAASQGTTLPAKYTDPTNPAVTFEVPAAGTQNATLELSSK